MFINFLVFTKSGFKRLAHQDRHPERSEGSRREILRCAQNDSPEKFHDKVYQCLEFWFSADTTGVGHWHTYKIVHCARLTHSVPLLLARRCLSCEAFIQTLPVAATLTAFQPRAPPMLLSLDHKQS